MLPLLRGASNLSLLQSVHTGSGATQPPVQLVLGFLALGVNRPNVNLITHPHPVTSLRMSGAIPPLFHIHSLCTQKQLTYTNTSLLMNCEVPTPITSFYYLHAVYTAQALYKVFQE